MPSGCSGFRSHVFVTPSSDILSMSLSPQLLIIKSVFTSLLTANECEHYVDVIFIRKLSSSLLSPFVCLDISQILSSHTLCVIFLQVLMWALVSVQ